MKIYDITQEVFGSVVFDGDPVPEKNVVLSIDRGDVCNLTQFSMCAHNGTHIDAPYHFLADGCTVENIPLDKTVGMAYVAEHEGTLSAEDVQCVLQKAKAADAESAKRILIKGKATVSYGAAEVFARNGVLLVGNESQTVGPEDAPMGVHKLLLGVGTVLLEGVRLSEVSEGVYFLNAAPLCLGGSDGAPCRAVLVSGISVK